MFLSNPNLESQKNIGIGEETLVVYVCMKTYDVGKTLRFTIVGSKYQEEV